LRQIDAVQTADDVGVLNPGAAGALATAQDLRQQLDEALTPSTVDSDRLRVSGLLGDSLPVIASLERASQESGLNAAQGHLNHAWAEANEALSEIRPIAPSRPLAQPAPAVLPSPVISTVLRSQRRRLSPDQCC